MGKIYVLVPILVIFFNQKTHASVLQPNTSCVSRLSSNLRESHLEAILNANLRFPQNAVGIDLAALAAFLRNSILMKDFTADLSDAEADKFVESMNKAHAAYQVSPVSLNNNKRHSVSYVVRGVQTRILYHLLRILHRDGESIVELEPRPNDNRLSATFRIEMLPYARKQDLYNLIDQRFYSVTESDFQKRMQHIGISLENALVSPKVQEASKAFRESMRNGAKPTSLYGFPDAITEELSANLALFKINSPIEFAEFLVERK